MIWILLVIALLIGFLGGEIYDRSFDFEQIGFTLSIVGFSFAVVAGIAAIILTCCCFDVAKIDEKIELYEVENAAIEQRMMEIVQRYQAREQEIFGEITEKNAMTYITLYPELRSDSLIEKQMTLYYSNHEKLVYLKEQQLMAPLYRWWVYFGR